MKRTLPSIVSIVLAACLSVGTVARAQQPTVGDAAREQAAMEKSLQEFRQRAKRALLEECARARDQVAALRQRETAFESRMDALKQNGEGKRLASDAATVASIFHQGLMRPVVSLQQLDAKISELDGVVGKLNAPGDGPGDDVLAASRDLPFETRAWLALRSAELTERTRWFDAAIQRAPASAEAGAPAFGTALDSYAVEFDKWSAELFRKGTQLAKQEKEQEVVERGRMAALLQAEAKLREMEERNRVQLDEERVRHQSEIERKLGEIARLDRENAALRANRALEDAKAATAAGAVQNEAEREQLRKRCKDAEVQTTLQPFITPGYWQLAVGGKASTGVAKKPMSLNAIKSVGALRADDAGYLALVRIAVENDNDRPHWSIHYAGGRTFQKATNAQKEEVVKAQQLLNELGPTLVELGMLSE